MAPRRKPTADPRQLSFWIAEFREEVLFQERKSSLIEELRCLEWELENSHRDLLRTVRALRPRLTRVLVALDHINNHLSPPAAGPPFRESRK